LIHVAVSQLPPRHDAASTANRLRLEFDDKRRHVVLASFGETFIQHLGEDTAKILVSECTTTALL
jgi:hypothetical protein